MAGGAEAAGVVVVVSGGAFEVGAGDGGLSLVFEVLEAVEGVADLVVVKEGEKVGQREAEGVGEVVEGGGGGKEAEEAAGD